MSQLSWRLRFKSFASEVLISTQLACDDLTKDLSPFDCLCIFKNSMSMLARQDPATPTVPVAGAAIPAEGVIIAVVHHDRGS